MSGTVKGSILDPDSKAMANCQLFMYRRTDGTLLGSTVSNENGDYELTHTAEDGEEVFVVCLDNDDLPDFEGLVQDRVTIKNNTSSTGCEGATDTAILSGFNVTGWVTPPTVDVYINDVLVATDVQADAYINQVWFNNQALVDNANQVSYSVYGDSSARNYFTSQSSSYIKFKFVPNRDGSLGEEIYLAKDALTIGDSNSNPTVYKDTETGVITFCLAPNAPTGIINT